MLSLPNELKSTTIPLINDIEIETFQKILLRILERTHSSTETQIFTDQEELKLQSVLSINDPVIVKEVISSLSILWQQIVYHLLKPKMIVSELVAMGLSEEKAIVFAQMWASNMNKVCDKLRDSSYRIADQQLIDVNCKLQVHVSDSARGQVNSPLTQIDLVLARNDTKQHNVSLMFDHEELSQFYHQLESIQTQLDQLQK